MTCDSTLPIVRSQVQILRIEVWVTNRQGYDTSSRQIVGLMDLGEAQPYSNQVQTTAGGNGLPDPAPYQPVGGRG